jgi:hypothetical protein
VRKEWLNTLGLWQCFSTRWYRALHHRIQLNSSTPRTCGDDNGRHILAWLWSHFDRYAHLGPMREEKTWSSQRWDGNQMLWEQYWPWIIVNTLFLYSHPCYYKYNNFTKTTHTSVHKSAQSIRGQLKVDKRGHVSYRHLLSAHKRAFSFRMSRDAVAISLALNELGSRSVAQKWVDPLNSIKRDHHVELCVRDTSAF